MSLTINGIKKQLNENDINVISLLKMEKVELPEMVSVQINGDILDRNEFKVRILKDGDEIEFLYFMGGGSW